MILPLDDLDALRALRAYRRANGTVPTARIDLPQPDPSPQRRWTKRVLPLERLALDRAPDADRPLHLLSPTAAARPEASFLRTRVISGLPEGSFVELEGGVVVPCPELLFVRLTSHMTQEALALVGFELCGTYSRDPRDPRMGEVTFGLPPVTSVERVMGYLRRLGRRRGWILSRRALSLVRDNAWSPMEAVIAVMALLPGHEEGYEIGSVTLNRRLEAPEDLVRLGARESRVPDIQVDGSHVGLNYDGTGHLDLESVLAAAERGEDVDAAVKAVREKNRDDMLRTRELMAQGSVTLPVTSADLFLPGGLDAVMLELALARESLDGVSSVGVRTILSDSTQARKRQELIWSLLPWRPGIAHAREVLRLVPWRELRPRLTGVW